MTALLQRVSVATILVLGLVSGIARADGENIKIGILHSLTGTMAISESTLKDVMLMLIELQNARGGLLGRQLEPVVVDPASDWDRFADKARELIDEDNVDVVFGCWTSASRKAVLPVFEERNSLLFYPLQYEGQESRRNVFYTGATPNQQAIPAIDYLMDVEGVERWILVGTDYVYPRTTFAIVSAYLASRGVAEDEITVHYTPFGQADWSDFVTRVKNLGRQGKRTAVLSAINGDANLPFYRELSEQGIDGADIPVLALSIGEEELSGIDASTLEGHFAVWNYFQSVDTPLNREFIAAWQDYTGDVQRVTNDPMEAHFIGFSMWVAAVERAGTTATDAVIDALVGVRVPNLTGGHAEMLPNHHVTKPVLVGEMRDNGQFEIRLHGDEPVPGDAWSDYLPESRHLQADWRPSRACEAYDTTVQRCVPAPAGKE
ncbi:MAG: urea ABC transporter substrate-binding protein [Gammaproteobacteria bacterium]|nr:MAG: urea ABC transporter substrate-binding protein [Gammaproteobacteria bacterium]